MTNLIERMREELVRRNYAQTTIRTYLRVVEEFRKFIGKRLDCATAGDIRHYHAYLLGERKLAPHTVVQRVAAVRFLYCKTLKRREMREDPTVPAELRSKTARCP